VTSPKTIRTSWADLLDWRLDKQNPLPLSQQLYELVRDAVRNGAIPTGTRLPSSRQLTQRLGVSRTTVVTAFSQLAADGYIESKSGSGTYASEGSSDLVQTPASLKMPRGATPSSTVLSESGRRYGALSTRHLMADNKPFAVGTVRLDSRTSAQWRGLIRSRLTDVDIGQLTYSSPLGSLTLRRHIASYLRAARGVRCVPDQIILVSGAQQAIDLTIKVLLNAGDSVWVENPGYPLTHAALSAAEMVLRPVPVDEQGICVAEGIATHRDARAAFVTPSHQYPLGVAMSMSRRIELLKWARQQDAWIIEDDCDAEYRYRSPPLAALQGLDDDGRVIYVGTFSKVLFPGLRYGYAVVPLSLVRAISTARMLSDRHPPIFFQEVLAEFMERGYFTSHIRRMRIEYQRAQEMLVELLTRKLGHLLDVLTPDQGMHIIAYLRTALRDTDVADESRAVGVNVRPLSICYVNGPRRSGLMLGFTGFNEHAMRSSVSRLTEILERMNRSLPASGSFSRGTELVVHHARAPAPISICSSSS